MRIAELSERSGVPVATIKYYVREGLLPPGTATAPNQARYDDAHLRRLSLIRALREGADLPIATLRRVLEAMDAHRDAERPTYLSTAIHALSDPPPGEDEGADAGAPEMAAARAQVDALLAELGWDVDGVSPGREDLVRALAAIHRFLPGLIADERQLAPYASAVRALADTEIPEGFDVDADRESALRTSVLGTVLLEPVLTSLRKLAHTDRMRELAARRRDEPAG